MIFQLSLWGRIINLAFPNLSYLLQLYLQGSSLCDCSFCLSSYTLSKPCDAFGVSRNHPDQQHPNHPRANPCSLLNILFSIQSLFCVQQGLENHFPAGVGQWARPGGTTPGGRETQATFYFVHRKLNVRFSKLKNPSNATSLKNTCPALPLTSRNQWVLAVGGFAVLTTS